MGSGESGFHIALPIPHSPFPIPHSRSMKAFVTGATGFIGGNLVRALLSDGRQVRALIRPGSDRRNVAGLPIETVEGDLEDQLYLAEQIAGCGAVFHVAAHYSLWAQDRDSIYR